MFGSCILGAASTGGAAAGFGDLGTCDMDVAGSVFLYSSGLNVLYRIMFGRGYRSGIYEIKAEFFASSVEPFAPSVCFFIAGEADSADLNFGIFKAYFSTTDF
jgi:hypothetical protein